MITIVIHYDVFTSVIRFGLLSSASSCWVLFCTLLRLKFLVLPQWHLWHSMHCFIIGVTSTPYLVSTVQMNGCDHQACLVMDKQSNYLTPAEWGHQAVHGGLVAGGLILPDASWHGVLIARFFLLPTSLQLFRSTTCNGFPRDLQRLTFYLLVKTNNKHWCNFIISHFTPC